MQHATIACLAAAVLLASCCASSPTASFPEEYYGYITQSVEYQSAFFYAIRGNPNATLRSSQPLVLFLQGGPGATSLFSNYLETGPEKLYLSPQSPGGYALEPRTHAWTNHATMLYVDNPIGTGFSYTVDPRGFSTTDEEIADNLINFLTQFYDKHPEYRNSQFWVFCESYGGKMTAYLGAAIVDAVANGTLPKNFQGVALGDGWVDPIDCMYSYKPYLETFSQLTPEEGDNITKYAQLAQSALEEGKGNDATNYWSTQQDYISWFTSNLNWYNSLYYYDYTADNQLDVFLATNFTQKLGSIVPNGVSYNAQSNDVFSYMGGSFMKDGIAQVAKILNNGYKVNIYTGQVDLIVDVVCMNAWVNKLNWAHLPDFYNSPRIPMQAAGDLNVGGFWQSYANLTIWNINKAGHMVPLDSPVYAEMMMATIVGGLEEGSKVVKQSEDFRDEIRMQLLQMEMKDKKPFHKRRRGV